MNRGQMCQAAELAVLRIHTVNNKSETTPCLFLHTWHLCYIRMSFRIICTHNICLFFPLLSLVPEVSHVLPSFHIFCFRALTLLHLLPVSPSWAFCRLSNCLYIFVFLWLWNISMMKVLVSSRHRNLSKYISPEGPICHFVISSYPPRVTNNTVQAGNLPKQGTILCRHVTHRVWPSTSGEGWTSHIFLL